MMKVVFACDSFKESMSAHHACLASKRGFDHVFENNY
ncbi:glycerate kinase [Breznakia sp. PH1-1]|nr:glycerate kinase [Breznakia sp. PH1-1]MDH6403668.1 glycerate kinase [Breznakia sp. PF1-11]MDH6411377.1 glycerate kinase [Breznakia sp. PFB1-11]MDH6413647.1 glycerate kinase [Breznakia sp. PFB1-14]MDH6415922.1 glycerate kinase [Breznakia sp. PFB1-4]MDH6418315.1 glycerate kinase [Breznakia sp. PFB1-12]MDH6474338.1 glycerate kinase [Breznakia sp. PFB2-30]MDH6475849.1 glycerate kinase [Breznakia sp. PFB1-19]